MSSRRRNVKTTWAGSVQAIGLAFFLGAHLEKDPRGWEVALLEPENAALAAAVLGALGTGMFARDYDVTSEGTRIRKD